MAAVPALGPGSYRGGLGPRSRAAVRPGGRPSPPGRPQASRGTCPAPLGPQPLQGQRILRRWPGIPFGGPCRPSAAQAPPGAHRTRPGQTTEPALADRAGPTWPGWRPQQRGRPWGASRPRDRIGGSWGPGDAAMAVIAVGRGGEEPRGPQARATARPRGTPAPWEQREAPAWGSAATRRTRPLAPMAPRGRALRGRYCGRSWATGAGCRDEARHLRGRPCGRPDEPCLRSPRGRPLFQHDEPCLRSPRGLADRRPRDRAAGAAALPGHLRSSLGG